MAIQLFMPHFEVDECLKEIRICLEKGWTGLGFKTLEFEEKWKEYTGLPHAHFLCSATAGLHLAVKVLKMENGWRDDDEIISTPLTFISTNHAIFYENMKIVFADVDKYLCLDPKSVEERITSKTKAVMFVGLGGNIGQYFSIAEICKKYNLKLILDAAHMSGTRFKGIIPGAEADAAIYSYQAVKNLPTADSGMVCFKKKSHDEIVRKLSWLGINKDTYSRTNTQGNYKWKYDVEYLGFKDHGNSIMAAIGLVQLRYLDRDNAYRRQLARWYDEGFHGNNNIKPVPVIQDCESSRHLYIIQCKNRDKLMENLNQNEIYPGVHYRDNLEYEMYSYARGTCPRAHELSESILSLPMHMGLTKIDVNYICKIINNFTRK
jgi:dTDP-4-amino-4,6-dideoxygalactose transaminase